MRLSNIFAFGGGSVPGSAHRQKGVKNHDSLTLISTPETDLIVGIVSDGCGGSEAPEVGSRILADTLASELLRLCQRLGPTPENFHEILQKARGKTEEVIDKVCKALRGNAPQGTCLSQQYIYIVQRHFMATVVGFVMTPGWTFVFHKGDGVIDLNGDTVIMEPHYVTDTEGNTYELPAYPCYALLYGDPDDSDTYKDDTFDFLVLQVVPTSEVNELLIGTDGVDRFVKHPERKDYSKKPIGPLHQFYDDIYRAAPHRVQNRLNACGPFTDWKVRSLDDDTTILLVLRKLVPSTVEGADPDIEALLMTDPPPEQDPEPEVAAEAAQAPEEEVA